MHVHYCAWAYAWAEVLEQDIFEASARQPSPHVKEFIPQGWLGTGQVALNLGFDLDLWGRNKAALAAATSQARAAQLDAQQARLALTTGIADAYADLARLYDEAELQQRTLDIRTASQKLVADRRQNGLETRGNVRQSDATVAAARAQLAGARVAIALRHLSRSEPTLWVWSAFTAATAGRWRGWKAWCQQVTSRSFI